MNNIRNLAHKSLLLLTFINFSLHGNAGVISVEKEIEYLRPHLTKPLGLSGGGVTRGIQVEEITSRVVIDEKGLPKTLSSAYAEKYARKLFKDRFHLPKGYTLFKCAHKIKADNGYDSLFVILDPDGDVAKFDVDGDLLSVGRGLKKDEKFAIIINESKFSSKNKFILNGSDPDTGLPIQMSNEWVVDVVERLLEKYNGVEETCSIRTMQGTEGEIVCKSGTCTDVYGILQKHSHQILRTGNLVTTAGDKILYALGDTEKEVDQVKKIITSVLRISGSSKKAEEVEVKFKEKPIDIKTVVGTKRSRSKISRSRSRSPIKSPRGKIGDAKAGAGSRY